MFDLPEKTKLYLFLASLVFLVGCAGYFNLMEYLDKIEPDGPVEEFVEEIIKEEYGIDIDLTPFSPE